MPPQQAAEDEAKHTARPVADAASEEEGEGEFEREFEVYGFVEIGGQGLWFRRAGGPLFHISGVRIRGYISRSRV